MTPGDFIRAARVPASLQPQTFGLWTIQRLPADGVLVGAREVSMYEAMVGFPDYTLLRRVTLSSSHLNTAGEIVMEDSIVELWKHLPIWMAARGRVLVTGLGLGCVVRGLLAKPEVGHIDVVEIDPQIIRVIGPEFEGQPRVRIHHGDALKFEATAPYDFAWHDLWVDSSETEDSLHMLHGQLLHRFRDHCGPQGAWAFPRPFKRMMRQRAGFSLLG